MAEWISIGKAILLVACSWFFGAIIVGALSLVYFALTGKFDSETAGSFNIGEYDWLVHVVDIFAFAGFYKAISFFKENRLLNMLIVTGLLVLIFMIEALFYLEEIFESLLNIAIIFGIMFTAYGVHLIVHKDKQIKT